jgi:hypothetical protein
LTPDVVPYQGLAPYKYLVVGLVPRFLWPEKPQFDEANRFVQVAYGLTREENLSQVSMAVGIISEGYMAAGWIGVLLAGGVLGGVCGLIESFLGRENLGALPNAIAIALLPRFLVVESQMTQLFSGLLQTVLVCWVVFSIGMPRIRTRQGGEASLRAAEVPREPDISDSLKSLRDRRRIAR